MDNLDFIDELQEYIYDEQAYINVLTEYCINSNDINEGYVYRLLKHLCVINSEILNKIDTFNFFE